MTRTFIALEMNESLRSYLEEVIDRVAQVLRNAQVVKPAGIHLTLAFLGELNDVQLTEAMQATEAAAQQVSPFTYRLARPGIFGSVSHPRVLWMGIEEPSGSLGRLHRILNQQLEQRGFEIDRRPFSPHLTLARFKQPLTLDERQGLQRLLATEQRGNVVVQRSPAEQVSVMKSELSRKGAQYTCLKQYALGSM
jgi:RNA 2',3'-cyclic 3'-phosphodiesterase